MSPEKTKEFLPIIQAYADGKTVQWNANEPGIEPKWIDCGNFHPTIFGDPEPTRFRIKPEPREFWIVNYQTTQPVAYSSLDAAKRGQIDCSHTIEIIHVREVLP